MDPRTNAILSISAINDDFTAQVVIVLPDNTTKNYKNLQAGSTWDFEYDKKSYKMILMEVNWYSESFNVKVKEL